MFHVCSINVNNGGSSIFTTFQTMLFLLDTLRGVLYSIQFAKSSIANLFFLFG